MLKHTVKISLSLVHVSVQLDHPQGALAEPCESHNIVESISESTSLYVMRCCGSKYFSLRCVYCLPCCVRLSQGCICWWKESWYFLSCL